MRRAALHGMAQAMRSSALLARKHILPQAANPELGAAYRLWPGPKQRCKEICPKPGSEGFWYSPGLVTLRMKWYSSIQFLSEGRPQ